MSREIIVIAHNLRSAHNVGSLFRTCEGMGIIKLYLTGYTPYPQLDSDERMPHIAKKVNAQIEKTALGAIDVLSWQKSDDINEVIREIKELGFVIAGLEQAKNSKELNNYKAPDKIALILGNEVDGIDDRTLKLCDEIIEIPMLGKKESFNVVQAAAMALYGLRYMH